MTSKNGETQFPQAVEEALGQQPTQIAPLDVHLNSCRFAVAKTPDGMTVISFQHMSGVVSFTAMLPQASVDELVRQLSGGIEIAKAMPVLQ